MQETGFKLWSDWERDAQYADLSKLICAEKSEKDALLKKITDDASIKEQIEQHFPEYEKMGLSQLKGVFSLAGGSVTGGDPGGGMSPPKRVHSPKVETKKQSVREIINETLGELKNMKKGGR